MHTQDTYLTQQTMTRHNGRPVGIESMLVLIMALQAQNVTEMLWPSQLKTICGFFILRFLRLGVKEGAVWDLIMIESVTNVLPLGQDIMYFCRKSLRSGPRSETMQNIIVMTNCLFNTRGKNNENISFKPLAQTRKVNTRRVLHQSLLHMPVIEKASW